MNRLFFLVIALGSVAAACVPEVIVNGSGGGDAGHGQGGGNGGQGGSGNTGAAGAGTGEPALNAHDFYVEKVYPILIQACGACHGDGAAAGVFVDVDVEISYTKTKGYPGFLEPPMDSLLISKGPHGGPALSDAQAAVVAEWLTLELQ
jgi:hypothetical protein